MLDSCANGLVITSARVRRSEHIVRSRIRYKSDKFNPPQCLPENYPGHRSYKLAGHLCNALEQNKKNQHKPLQFFLWNLTWESIQMFPAESDQVKASAQVGMALCCSTAEPLCHFLCSSHTVFFHFPFLSRNCSTKAGEVLIKGADQWGICTRQPQSLTFRDEQKFFEYIYCIYICECRKNLYL